MYIRQQSKPWLGYVVHIGQSAESRTIGSIVPALRLQCIPHGGYLVTSESIVWSKITCEKPVQKVVTSTV